MFFSLFYLLFIPSLLSLFTCIFVCGSSSLSFYSFYNPFILILPCPYSVLFLLSSFSPLLLFLAFSSLTLSSSLSLLPPFLLLSLSLFLPLTHSPFFSFSSSPSLYLLHYTAVDINSLMFARGTRFSQMEAQEKYKDECQRVFDIQNK